MASERQNSPDALRHELLSGTVVLECESSDRFLELLTALSEELQPRTVVETQLVETMAVARWRQMRLWGMEKAGMDHAIQQSAGTINPAGDSATSAALAFRRLSDDSHCLDLMSRCESRFDRQYLRAHRRLLELRNRPVPPKTNLNKRTPELGENNEHPVAPVPVPVPVAPAVEAVGVPNPNPEPATDSKQNHRVSSAAKTIFNPKPEPAKQPHPEAPLYNCSAVANCKKMATNSVSISG